MKKREAWLQKLTAICGELAETESKQLGNHTEFRVHGRVFAYFLDNHHGDGIVSVCCKTQMGENVDRASQDPQRYYLPAYIGPRGWFGMRLDRGAIDWSEVRNIVENSYRLAAPKRLARAMDEKVQG
jgi:predicted DNA-binding protein (MmcQ/YjbR family)